VVTGSDESLVREAAQRAIDGSLGSEDRSFALAEFDGDDYEIAALVDAAQTPPMFTAHRVVVARNLGGRRAEELSDLLRYLADPLDTTTLILVWPGAKPAKAVADALKQAGAETISADPGFGAKGRQQWLDDAFALAEVRLDPGARALVGGHLGDDLARLGGLLATLSSAFGREARLTAADVEPYLGEAGAVPPWELTDAIDRGDGPGAAKALHRMLNAGDRHPLQIMATLQSHHERIVRLHGSGAASEADAARVLGIKGSTFPARKALDRARKLGPDRIGRSIELLAAADTDLRGGSAWPGELVLEVLVARLARLGR
jgi:DNA polymerase-3 subunit delta